MKTNFKSRISALLLAGLMSFCCLAFQTSIKEDSVLAATGGDDTVVLYDFETEYDRANVISRYHFGKTQLSDKHVVRGHKSMYLEVEGIYPEDEETHMWPYEHLSSNYIKLSSIGGNKSFSVTDYTQFKTLEVDIYNDSGRDVHTEMLIQTELFGDYNVNNYYYTTLGKHVLLDGQNNHITIDLNKYKYCGLDNVYAVYFTFDFLQEGETPYKLYMDNFVGKKADKPFDMPVLTPTGVVGDVVIGFENDFEADMMRVARVFNQPMDYTPQLEITHDPAYVKEGNGALKLTVGRSNYYCACGENGDTGFTIIHLFGKYFFNGINYYDYTHPVVEFDIMTTTPNAPQIQVGTSWVYPQVGSWRTYRSELWYDATNGGITHMNIAVFEYQRSEDSVYYLDNFRLVEA